jgi:hypothetical protein
VNTATTSRHAKSRAAIYEARPAPNRR